MTRAAGPRRLWDISAPVGAASPVFPGDTSYQQDWSWTLGPNCPVNVSRLTLSPHVGTHADAPLHYQSGAPAAGALDLAPYLGPCRVIHALQAGAVVVHADVAHALGPDLPARVLLRTYHRQPSQWDPQGRGVDPALLHALADRGVLLVGIDTASVDPVDSKHLAAHQVLLQRHLRVLENLVLDEVPEGDYELVALPLKLVTADASPVRAVLRAL